MMTAEIERLIECGICLEILDESHKMLPCQHSFHKNCLEKMTRKQINLICPICRMYVTVPIDCLKNNIMVSGLIDCYKKNTRSKPTDTEEKELSLALALSRKEFEEQNATLRKSSKTSKAGQNPILSVDIEVNSRKLLKPSRAKQNPIPSVDNINQRNPPSIQGYSPIPTINYHLPPPVVGSNTFPFPSSFQSSMPCPPFSFTSMPPPTSLPYPFQPSTFSSQSSSPSMLISSGGSLWFVDNNSNTSSSTQSNAKPCRPTTSTRFTRFSRGKK